MEFSCPVLWSPTPHPALLWSSVQVLVEGPASSMELQNLTSSTEYLISVLPVYEGGVGEGLQGLAITGRWGACGSLPTKTWLQQYSAVGSPGSKPGLCILCC
jgi:hypothetical protein